MRSGLGGQRHISDTLQHTSERGDRRRLVVVGDRARRRLYFDRDFDQAGNTAGLDRMSDGAPDRLPDYSDIDLSYQDRPMQ